MRSATDNTEDKAHVAERRSLRSSLRALYDQKAHSDYLYRERCAEVEALRAQLTEVLGELEDAKDALEPVEELRGQLASAHRGNERLSTQNYDLYRQITALEGPNNPTVKRLREERDAANEQALLATKDVQKLRADNKALSDVIERAVEELQHNEHNENAIRKALAILTAGDDERTSAEPCRKCNAFVTARCGCGAPRIGFSCSEDFGHAQDGGRAPSCLCGYHKDTAIQSPVSATPTVSSLVVPPEDVKHLQEALSGPVQPLEFVPPRAWHLWSKNKLACGAIMDSRSSASYSVADVTCPQCRVAASSLIPEKREGRVSP